MTFQHFFTKPAQVNNKDAPYISRKID